MGNGSSAQIQGHGPKPGDTTTWRNIAATQLSDGTWALKVDTELVLDAGNISISNIKVGATDQSTSNLRYIKTLDDGTVVIESNDPFTNYKAARSTRGAYPRYYGLVDDNQAWIIIKEERVGSEDIYTYSSGSSNFVSNWNNRVSLSFNEYYDEF